MKNKILALTAFMAIALSGCGYVDEATTSTKDNREDLIAERSEVQTEVISATTVSTSESSSTEKNVTTAAENAATVESSEISTLDETEEDTGSLINDYEVKNQETTQETKNMNIGTTSTEAETSPYEIATETPVNVNSEISEIFQKLNNLQYEPITCDGIPEKTFIAEDGTAYAVNFSERWVWRNGVEQAELTDEMYFALIDSEPICLQ